MRRLGLSMMGLGMIMLIGVFLVERNTVNHTSSVSVLTTTTNDQYHCRQ